MDISLVFIVSFRADFSQNNFPIVANIYDFIGLSPLFIGQIKL